MAEYTSKGCPDSLKLKARIEMLRDRALRFKQTASPEDRIARAQNKLFGETLVLLTIIPKFTSAVDYDILRFQTAMELVEVLVAKIEQIMKEIEDAQVRPSAGV